MIDQNISSCSGEPIAQFAGKLYRMLHDPEAQAAIKWRHDMQGIMVTNIEQLEQNVLPRYFRHSKYSSFVRQLNMYDFHKKRNQSDDNIFCHCDFTQLDSTRLHRIRRKGLKKHDKENTPVSTPLWTPKNTEQLITELVQNVKDRGNSIEEQRKLVFKMREQDQFQVISGSKYLEDIYFRLGIEKQKDCLSELSIEEEIEFGQKDPQLPFKSLALLKSQLLLLRKQSSYFNE